MIHQQAPITINGGVQLGLSYATWPLATFFAYYNELVLEVAIYGRFVFPRCESLKIRPKGLIPYLGTGIRILHSIDWYPEYITFSYWAKTADTLINELRLMGYQCVER